MTNIQKIREGNKYIIMKEMKVGQRYILKKEPRWSTGGREGREVEVIDMGYYLAFRIVEDIKNTLSVTWPVNMEEVT